MALNFVSLKSIALRFWLTLLVQTGLILAIPAQAVYLQLTGKTVVLQTGSIDPYSLFQGYHLTLSYNFSEPQVLEGLAGWQQVQARANAGESQSSQSALAAGTDFYLVLQAPARSNTQPPEVWQPVRVAIDYPTQLPDNQVALRGVYRQGQISYGLETYYIPEDQQAALNTQMSQLRSTVSDSPFRVEVKVGSGGRAIPSGFWVEQHHYQF
jgi:uncharacterized membrane-anchored protein